MNTEKSAEDVHLHTKVESERMARDTYWSVQLCNTNTDAKIK